MKTKTKFLLTSGMTVVMSASLIAGATYAIFTDESPTNIAVNAGKVNIVATAAISSAWSADPTDNSERYNLTETDTGYIFYNGGKVFYDADTVTFQNITPGDGAEISINIKNYSNVKTKYRIEVYADPYHDSGNDLFPGLEIKLGGKLLESTNDKLYSEWAYLGIEQSPEDPVTVSIELPITNEDQNEYQETGCGIIVNVFAVQSNAYIADTLFEEVLTAVSKSEHNDSQAIVFGTLGQYGISSLALTRSTPNLTEVATLANGQAKLYFSEEGVDGYANGAFYVLANDLIDAVTCGLEFAGTDFKYVDLSGVNFKNATQVSNMFDGSGIETLVMKGANLSNAEDLKSMFTGCEQTLKSVDFSGADLSKLTKIWSEFAAKEVGGSYYAPALQTVNFAGADLSGLTTLESAFAYDINLTDVNFSGAILSNVEGMGAMFRSCTKLVSADFSEAKLPELVSMSSTDQGQALPHWGDGTYNVGMFDGCYALTDVNFADAEFGKLKDMSNLFHNCVAIQTFTFSEVFSNCNLSTVTDIHQMFYYNIDPKYVEEDPSLATHLKSVDLSGMQFKSVKYASGVFHGCSVLVTADFTGADLSGVTYTGTGMFLGTGSVKEIILKNAILGPAMCSNLFAGVGDLLETVDLSGADCTYVTDMSGMFAVGVGAPTALKSVSFKGAKNLDNVTNMYQMFNNCSALESVDFTDCNLSKVTNMANMFNGCTSLKEVDFTNVDLSGVTGTNGNLGTGMAGMFNSCTSLKSVSFARAILSNVQFMSQMFNHSGVQTVDFTEAHLENVPSSSFQNIFYNADDLTTVIFKGAHLEGLTSMDSLFNATGQSRAKNVEMVDFSGAHLDNVTSMSYIFMGSKVGTVNFSGANLSSVTNISSLFSGCSKLQTVNFSGATFSTLTSLANMFQNCTSLTSFDFSEIFAGIDLSAVTSTNYMFDGCSQLESVDLSDVSLTAVTSMNYMFNGCSSLQELDLSEFNFANVNNMQYTFSGCTSLTAIDLGEANFTKSVNVNYLFQNCAQLADIYVSRDVNFVNNWNFNAGNVFAGCNKLFELYPGYTDPTSGSAHGRTGNNGYLTVGSLKDSGVPQD